MFLSKFDLWNWLEDWAWMKMAWPTCVPQTTGPAKLDSCTPLPLPPPSNDLLWRLCQYRCELDPRSAMSHTFTTTVAHTLHAAQRPTGNDTRNSSQQGEPFRIDITRIIIVRILSTKHEFEEWLWKMAFFSGPLCLPSGLISNRNVLGYCLNESPTPWWLIFEQSRKLLSVVEICLIV